MIEPIGLLLIHMSPALVMGTVLIVNLIMRRQRERLREAADGRRMALALSVELRSLLDSFNENLNLIAAGSSFLVSTRAAGALYRASLNRVVPGLDESGVAPVVAAFSYQQRIEAYLSACTKPNGPCGVHVLPKTPMQELKQRYVRGVRSVQLALAALEPLAAAPAETVPARGQAVEAGAPQAALLAAR